MSSCQSERRARVEKLKVHQTLTANDESTRRAVRMERIKTMIHEQTRQTKDHKSKKIMHKIRKNKEANMELLHNFVEQKQQPSSIIRDAKYSAVPPPKENIKDRTCMGTTWLSKKQITDTESNKRRLSKFSDSLSCIACVAGIPPSESRHDDELLLDNKVKEMLQKELEDSSMIMNTKKVAFLSDLVGDFDEHVRDDLLCNYGNVIEEAKGSNKTPPTKMNERYKGHMSRTGHVKTDEDEFHCAARNYGRRCRSETGAAERLFWGGGSRRKNGGRKI